MTDRLKRAAEALRANLQRRKAQARGRKAGGEEVSVLIVPVADTGENAERSGKDCPGGSEDAANDGGGGGDGGGD